MSHSAKRLISQSFIMHPFMTSICFNRKMSTQVYLIDFQTRHHSLVQGSIPRHPKKFIDYIFSKFLQSIDRYYPNKKLPLNHRS